jgi:hypothetical protein
VFTVAAAVVVGKEVFSLVQDKIMATETSTAKDFSMLVVRIYKQLLVILQQDSLLLHEMQTISFDD